MAVLYIPFSVVLIFFILLYTSIAVDEYIVTGIQAIAATIRISETLSAVTLLAFANGAGDVITAFLASGTEKGVAYNIGALYGAGLFMCTVVLATSIFKTAKPIIFDSMMVFRDIGVYIIATLFTIGLGVYGEIPWWASLVFFGLYLLIVIAVLVEDFIVKKKQNPNNTSLELVKRTVLGDKVQLNASGINQSFGVLKRRFTFNSKEKTYDDDFQYKVNTTAPLMELRNTVNNSIMDFTMFVEKKVELAMENRHTIMRKKHSIIRKIQHILEKPFAWIMYLTALPVSVQQYSKARCVIYPIPGLMFIWYIFHPTFDLTYLQIPLPIGIALILIFMVVLDKKEPPRWMIVFVLAGVASGLFWSYLLLGALIDLLETLGIVFNLSEVFMGLTIVGIGNSLPDAITTLVLIRQGAGKTAISAGYAGQLFGYLIGFGIGMLKANLSSGKAQKFELFSNEELSSSILELAVLGTALLVLTLTFVYSLSNKLLMTKGYAFVLFGIYIIFFIGCSVLAIRNAYIDF